MLFRFFIKYPLLAIILHIALGVCTKFIPVVITFYLLSLLIMGVVEIYKQRDANHLTAYYLVYITGLEILYRIGKFYIFWELGKYICIIIAIVGLFASRKSPIRALPFLLYFLLLLPGIIIALLYGYVDDVYLRKLILQSLSGPLTLFFVGVYFYKIKMDIAGLQSLLKTAILPCISLVMVLFLGANLSTIDFISASNFSASGGFGPNQVSTMLGYGVMLLIFSLFNRWILTWNIITDLGLLGLLAFRGLLTFSRGGMLSAVVAAVLSIFIVMIFSRAYQRRFFPIFSRIVVASFILILVAIAANQLTNNYLLYRYQGKSNSEILRGRKDRGDPDILSGRGEVISEELHAFTEYPFFGVGVGRGTLYRMETLKITISSHTEFSRLLGEHGMAGLLAMVIVFFVLPVNHFLKYKNTLTRHWFLMFYLLAMFTMFHAGMRLAMPGVVFGLAFVLIYHPPVRHSRTQPLQLENTPSTP